MVAPPDFYRGAFLFLLMLKRLDAQHNDYRLTIEYNGREFNYRAKMIAYHIGEERWMIWTKNRVLSFIYNTATKKLKEDILHGQPPLPEDFTGLIEEALRSGR